MGIRPVVVTVEMRDKFSKEFNKVGKEMVAFGDRLSSVSNAIRNKIAVPFIGLTVASTKFGMEVEKNMASVRKNTGMATDKLQQFKKELTSIATMPTSTFGQDIVTKIAGDLTQAGYTAEKIKLMMPGIIKGAQLGDADPAFVAEGLVSVMETFGRGSELFEETAGKIASVSVATKADFSSLLESFKTAGPIAKAVGMSFEETLAHMGVLQQRGLLGAETGTAIKMLTLSFTTLRGEAKVVADQFNRAGVAFEDTEGNLRKPVEILKDMANVMDKAGLGTADKANIYSILGGSFVTPAMASLIEDISRTNSLHGQLVDSMKMWKSDLDFGSESMSTGGFAELAKAIIAIKVAFESFYNDVLKDKLIVFFKRIQELAKLFMSMPTWAKEFIFWFGAISVTTLTVLSSIGSLYVALGGMKVLISSLVAKGELTLLAGGFKGIASGLGLLVLKAGALGVLVTIIANIVSGMRDWKKVQDEFDTGIESSPLVLLGSEIARQWEKAKKEILGVHAAVNNDLTGKPVEERARLAQEEMENNIKSAKYRVGMNEMGDALYKGLFGSVFAAQAIRENNPIKKQELLAKAGAFRFGGDYTGPAKDYSINGRLTDVYQPKQDATFKLVIEGAPSGSRIIQTDGPVRPNIEFDFGRGAIFNTGM